MLPAKCFERELSALIEFKRATPGPVSCWCRMDRHNVAVGNRGDTRNESVPRRVAKFRRQSERRSRGADSLQVETNGQRRLASHRDTSDRGEDQEGKTRSVHRMDQSSGMKSD